MDKRDYEWHYYIGGNCSLTRRKYGGHLATIEHIEQGVYEAVVYRDQHLGKPISVGVFNDSNEAQEVIHQVLEPLWEKT